MILKGDSDMTVRQQCDLLGISRGSVYYKPRGAKASDLAVMHLIDEQYTATPYYGVERMTDWLHRIGITIGHNRVRRLMRLMGLEALYPKPRLSSPSAQEHGTYPYLLAGRTIERPDDVWATDITYIRLRQGFVYLTAVMDWYSRYILSWSLSTTLNAEFCVEALRDALAISQPEIFNTDQGSQFTCSDFTGVLEEAKVTISMDGKGRAFDNIFVERLWRTVKYEEVYLKDYSGVDEARSSLGQYLRFYNLARLHSSLGGRTPFEVYFGKTVNFRELLEQRYESNPVFVSSLLSAAGAKK